MNVSNSSRELQALIDFRWPHTNSSAHHCHWEGITCDDHGRVAEISLQSKVGCDDKPWWCHDVGYWSLSLSNLTNLEVLLISYNSIFGAIPSAIGSISKLTHLDLSYNSLKSELPLSLSNLTNLEVLSISYNRIFGTIPSGIGYLLHLIALDLSLNNINGSLPSTKSQLARLEILKLDGNSLGGVFEAGIRMLPSIKMINLSRNSIKEQIPLQFGCVANAQLLNIDLSWNQLIGEVPTSISSLEGINFSYNNLEGEIPANVWHKFGTESFRKNTNLHPPVASRITVEIIYYLIFVFFILCGIYFIFFTRGRNGASSVTPDPKHGDIFKIWNFDGNIAYQDIIDATQDFDLRCCIGTGAYGSVYRVLLPTGRLVAVKKLHRFEGDNPTFDSSFRNEAGVLSQIRHRHIVKLFGFCLHQRSMFLIYDYMERGSLFSVLKYDDEAVELNW
ncbi:MDIS1-interacting receptor like kinase 2-like [Salvia hispanica]|uniref:MDIS1-interacting receptor like kinase 2-like n=1 Tax=Salvia hispanica TaxID=49212 RepID=UPI0020097C0E|nr:MDIS1-interacting receptor like kinase 2-like [Salvia hispanica]